MSMERLQHPVSRADIVLNVTKGRSVASQIFMPMPKLNSRRS